MRPLLICLLLLTAATPIHAGPFGPSPAQTKRSESVRENQQGATLTGFVKHIPFIGRLFALQKKLNDAMCTKLRALQEAFSGWHALLLFGIAFFYGVVHALGPGHAKFVMGSYMLTQGHSLGRSILAGSIFAATHAGMAVVVFLVFTLALHAGAASTDRVSAILYRASGAIIMVIGILLLYQAISGRGEHGNPLQRYAQRASLPVLAAASGLVPCPGTLLLLVFAQMVGAAAYGLLAALFLSLGMAVTVSAAAYLGALGAKGIQASRGGKRWGTVLRCVQGIGAAVVLLFGVTMALM